MKLHVVVSSAAVWTMAVALATGIVALALTTRGPRSEYSSDGTIPSGVTTSMVVFAPEQPALVSFDLISAEGPAERLAYGDRAVLLAIRRDGLTATIGGERVTMCEACRARCAAAVDAFLESATTTARPR